MCLLAQPTLLASTVCRATCHQAASELLPHYFNLARTPCEAAGGIFLLRCRGTRVRLTLSTTVAVAGSDFPLLAEQLSELLLSPPTIPHNLYFRKIR